MSSNHRILFYCLTLLLKMFILIFVVTASASLSYWVFFSVFPEESIIVSKWDALAPTVVSNDKLNHLPDLADIACPNISSVRQEMLKINYNSWTEQSNRWSIISPIPMRSGGKGSPMRVMHLNGTIITSLTMLDNQLTCQYGIQEFHPFNTLTVRLLSKHDEKVTMRRGLWLSFENVYKCPNYTEPCVFSINKIGGIQ